MMSFEIKVAMTYALIGILIGFTGMLTTHIEKLQRILYRMFGVWMFGLFFVALWLIWWT
jgi:sulfite exporter TauE/SafE